MALVRDAAELLEGAGFRKAKDLLAYWREGMKKFYPRVTVETESDSEPEPESEPEREPPADDAQHGKAMGAHLEGTFADEHLRCRARDPQRE